jgi:RHS repeat-associated protein
MAGANVYRFSSKEWLSSLGLYYFGYRFYDPNLQRWLNKDPLEEWGGINLYGYVGNDPVQGIDPLGEEDKDKKPGFWDWCLTWLPKLGRGAGEAAGVGLGAAECAGEMARLAPSCRDKVRALNSDIDDPYLSPRLSGEAPPVVSPPTNKPPVKPTPVQPPPTNAPPPTRGKGKE